MLRLGLTGGIGSGKSTVAEFFALHGAVVIDADAISRATTASGGPAIAPIAKAFGDDFIAADGALDRSKMRQTIFSDPTVRTRLESIIHPLVAQQTAQRAQNAEQAGAHCAVFDIPLLVESGRWRARVDLVLVVDCLVEVQIRRVMARNGLKRDEIESIIASQATRSARLCAADIVIFNGGPLREQIAHDVKQVAERLGL
ncbi:MAG: dephospho-CoA kinase [Burkholderiaceae bacterium]